MKTIKRPAALNASCPVRSAALIFGLSLAFLIITTGCAAATASSSAQTTAGITTTTSMATSKPNVTTTTLGTTTINTSGQTTKASTTASSSTMSSSQPRVVGKFSHDDLVIEGIRYLDSPETVVKILGNPVSQSTTQDPVTGSDLLSYQYAGLSLTFSNANSADKRFALREAMATSATYRFAFGLRVGDPANTVVQSFVQEITTKTFQGYQVQYGNPDVLNLENTSGDVTFGYYGDDLAYYLAMKPPYMSEFATVYDEMAMLQFEFTNQVVTRIVWYFGAGAE